MSNVSVPSKIVSRSLRVLTPLVIMTGCLFVALGQAELPHFTEIMKLTAQVPFMHWVGALGATVLSFWALGRYDAVAHRHLRTGIEDAHARRVGMASIAFSQAVGFGIFTGAFSRWRLMPQLSALQSAQLTGFVGITFMTALAVICGGTLILTGPGLGWRIAGMLILGTAVLACGLCFVHPEWRIRSLRLRLPSVQALLALLLWTLIDVVFAGMALWFLLPTGADVALGTLLPAYFLALGLAVVSSSPGGAGPLELAMLTLLPSVDPASLVAGLLAFRLVYYGLPAILSGTLLLFPQLLLRDENDDDDTAFARIRQIRPAVTQPYDRPQAETGIILQNGGHVMAFGLNQVALLDSPQLSAVLFDPLSGRRREIPEALKAHARGRNSVAAFYKCSARMAILARSQGWKILRIAKDAILDPTRFDIKGSSFRQLRRKLRHAEKSGLRVEIAEGDLPFEQMRAVDRDWCGQHGHARGTTMGQFEEGYVASQVCALAWIDERLIGFVTFHHCAQEWALDLVRILPGAPDGSGHALVAAVIDAAAAKGMTRLSLAAVPDHRFAQRLDRGLLQFKSCFAPQWEARYIAAPNWAQMAVALAELLRLVHRPVPPRGDAILLQTARSDLPDVDEQDADAQENAVALRRSA